MPNWCFNSATFSHDDHAQVDALAEAFNEGKPFATFQPPPSGEWEYGWCSENWGTKWDVQPIDSVESEDGSLSVMFDSAWAPPIGFYRHMESLGWSVDATYHESGMSFAGHYSDGDDNYYEYDFSNEDWREEIDDPDVLEILESEYESWLEWQEEESDFGDDDEDVDDDNDGTNDEGEAGSGDDDAEPDSGTGNIKDGS